MKESIDEKLEIAKEKLEEKGEKFNLHGIRTYARKKTLTKEEKTSDKNSFLFYIAIKRDHSDKTSSV